MSWFKPSRNEFAESLSALVKSRQVVVRQSEPLSEGQLAAALVVPDDNGVWRAVMQILDEEAEGCASSAQASVKDHGICASFVGGQEICGRVRQRMLSLREAGKQTVPK